jgi:hypothetical protein
LKKKKFKIKNVKNNEKKGLKEKAWKRKRVYEKM